MPRPSLHCCPRHSSQTRWRFPWWESRLRQRPARGRRLWTSGTGWIRHLKHWDRQRHSRQRCTANCLPAVSKRPEKSRAAPRTEKPPLITLVAFRVRAVLQTAETRHPFLAGCGVGKVFIFAGQVRVESGGRVRVRGRAVAAVETDAGAWRIGCHLDRRHGCCQEEEEEEERDEPGMAKGRITSHDRCYGEKRAGTKERVTAVKRASKRTWEGSCEIPWLPI